MKSVIISLGLSILFLTLASCEKDVENNPTVNIVGTWKLTDIHANEGNYAVISNGAGRVFTFKLEGQDYNTTTTYTENPNEFTSTGSYTAITIFDQSLPPDTTLVPFNNAMGSWSIDGDLLTHIIADDTTTITILELSDSKLKLRQDLEEEFIEYSNGFTTFKFKSAKVYSSFDKQ
jgi:hypothetical protein